MSKQKEQIIMYGSSEAATYKTGLSGWVCRRGIYWGNHRNSEHSARYSGCTHRECEKCGEIYRNTSFCRTCNERKVIERYNAMPKKPWDGESMIFSDSYDKFFSDMDEALEYCENYDLGMDELRLVICEPIYPRTIDDDYWEDGLLEDQTLADIDPDLAALVDKVNDYILKKKPILSWTPGKFALELPEPEGE